ncbi:MAG TPA: TonB-dependent receptor [Terriglobales bacterium]|nr:TonB-dependent receptor [Terriglobales bacterium]
MNFRICCRSAWLLCALAVPILELPVSAQNSAAEGATASAAVTAPQFLIRGVVKSGKTPLPGVQVTAANTLFGKKVSATTGLDGSYTLLLSARGRYVIKTDLPGFAPATKEVLLTQQAPQATVDADVMLASRAAILAAQQQQQTTGGTQAIAAAIANRGFQSVSLSSSDMTGDPGSSADTTQAGASLPFNGAGADSSTESVSINGAMGQAQNFGMNPDEIQDRIQEFRERAQREGRGGGGPGMGGFGGGAVMMLSRNFNINRPHGSLYYSTDNSIFDAAPYALNAASPTATIKPDYDQNRFGAVLGGPLDIPHVIHDEKTFVFGGWTGNRNTTPYDQFSVVPTAAERQGVFSSLPIQLMDPTTHQPIPGNILTNINPAAQALLPFIPLPNLQPVPGSNLNFHYVTALDQTQNQIFARVVHNFGEGATFMPFGGRGGRGGGGGRRARNNINFNLNYSNSHNQVGNPFPTLLGTSQVSGMNTGAGWVVSKGKLTNNLRFTYNRSHTQLSNQYQDLQNIAGQAGITGVSQDPFDFGVPGLSFTDFQSVRDAAAQLSTNQTFSWSDSVIWRLGKHNVRFGGDFRRIYNDLRSDQNARGSFTFTGIQTGFDFADFLLGLPQLASVQSGSTNYGFRANSWDLFAQDDWRLTGNLSLNAGLRYEYVLPFSEANGRLVNLDINPVVLAGQPVALASAGVQTVLPGAIGQFSGAFPLTLIEPDRNNFAPRIGIAWKPLKKTVVRAGYGINYNTTQYGGIVQNLAFQPPFAFTETNVTSPTDVLTLENSFSAPSSAVTNNFAVDKNYKLGYVQIWNLDIQRELSPSLVLNVGYNGAKGTDLDMERAPNRLPNGQLRIAGVQPFILETSQGDSILHAASVRLRKRLRHGVSVQGSYIFSKSIDNASSIGGGAEVVAQNDLDLAAERSLSSFDQRHRFTGNFMYELPFGTGKKWLSNGRALASIFGGLQWSGDFTIASGLPFTPRVLGAFTDVAQGVNGTLRADLTGAPITLSNPTIGEWFNTAAFIAPPAGQFGDGRRNIIEGPGELTFDMAFSKTLLVKDTRALEIRASANNIFNRPQFTAIDTVVNSPTFGQVIAVGAMRRVTLSARYRF